MRKSINLLVIAGIVLGASPALAQVPSPAVATGPAEKLVCKKVVSAEPGAKPVPMCLTKAQWTAKKLADAKDPNRIVCRYEQNSRSKFDSFKICMSAVEWENQRLIERQAVERIQNGVCVAGAGC
jgi:hypothetical protein